MRNVRSDWRCGATWGTVVFCALSCASGSSKKNGSSPPAVAAAGTGSDASAKPTSTATATGPGAAPGGPAPAPSPASVNVCTLDPSNITIDQYPYINAYYSGYDGGKDAFHLLLQSRSSTVTIADPTIASVEQITVQVPANVMAAMVAAAQKAIPTLNANQLTHQFGNSRTAYLITTLKAGSTSITISRNGVAGAPGTGGPPPGSHGGGGGGGGPGGGGPPVAGGLQGTSDVYLLSVSPFTADQVAKGKARYSADFDADNPACASCHLTGKDGAPSHALGTESTIPDIAVKQWATTGVIPTLKANIPHAWKFADSDQETGVVAYLRSLEANNLEAFLVAEFNFEFGTNIDPGVITP